MADNNLAWAGNPVQGSVFDNRMNRDRAAAWQQQGIDPNTPQGRQAAFQWEQNNTWLGDSPNAAYGGLSGWVASDDPRRVAALHQMNDASRANMGGGGGYRGWDWANNRAVGATESAGTANWSMVGNGDYSKGNPRAPSEYYSQPGSSGGNRGIRNNNTSGTLANVMSGTYNSGGMGGNSAGYDRQGIQESGFNNPQSTLQDRFTGNTTSWGAGGGQPGGGLTGIANPNPGQYSGGMGSIPTKGGAAPSNTMQTMGAGAPLGAGQLRRDIQSYFGQQNFGQSMDWLGGRLTRNQDGSATFSGPNGQSTNFNIDTDLSELMGNSSIAQGWSDMYGVNADQLRGQQTRLTHQDLGFNQNVSRAFTSTNMTPDDMLALAQEFGNDRVVDMIRNDPNFRRQFEGNQFEFDESGALRTDAQGNPIRGGGTTGADFAAWLAARGDEEGGNSQRSNQLMQRLYQPYMGRELETRHANVGGNGGSGEGEIAGRSEMQVRDPITGRWQGLSTGNASRTFNSSSNANTLDWETLRGQGGFNDLYYSMHGRNDLSARPGRENETLRPNGRVSYGADGRYRFGGSATDIGADRISAQENWAGVLSVLGAAVGGMALGGASASGGLVAPSAASTAGLGAGGVGGTMGAGALGGFAGGAGAAGGVAAGAAGGALGSSGATSSPVVGSTATGTNLGALPSSTAGATGGGGGNFLTNLLGGSGGTAGTAGSTTSLGSLFNNGRTIMGLVSALGAAGGGGGGGGGSSGGGSRPSGGNSGGNSGGGSDMDIGAILGALGGGNGGDGGEGGNGGGGGGMNLGGVLGALGPLITGAYDNRQQRRASDNMLNYLRERQGMNDRMYQPGTPEHDQMRQEMERRDAAAGRNSQYGVRETDLAARTAGIRMQANTQLTGQIARHMADAENQRASAHSGLSAALPGLISMLGGGGGRNGGGAGAGRGGQQGGTPAGGYTSANSPFRNISGINPANILPNGNLNLGGGLQLTPEGRTIGGTSLGRSPSNQEIEDQINGGGGGDNGTYPENPDYGNGGGDDYNYYPPVDNYGPPSIGDDFDYGDFI